MLFSRLVLSIARIVKTFVVSSVDNKFNVALKDGYNIFMAVAGECKDTMTIEKVDVEPEIYTLPGQDEGEGSL